MLIDEIICRYNIGDGVVVNNKMWMRERCTNMIIDHVDEVVQVSNLSFDFEFEDITLMKLKNIFFSFYDSILVVEDELNAYFEVW